MADSRPRPTMRRTRIVCVSDTHNYTFKLPKGDVLIHAGDLTNQGSYAELSKTVKWIEEADFEAKIVVAGNHDITLDKEFYVQHGSSFHNKNIQSPDECISLLTSSPTITYLNHSSAKIRLTSPSGPETEFTVFGSPYSPQYGNWAFYYPDAPIKSHAQPILWDEIPVGADIVVTHTPARGHCDHFSSSETRPGGCEALRRALYKVRPLLAVCGHIHAGRGAETVGWNLSRSAAPFTEDGAAKWDDPGAGEHNKKMSLVDLTSRRGGVGLDNDGSKQYTSHTGLKTGSSPALKQDESEGNEDGPSSQLGRRETCFVNAAIMKSRYPHTGGKQYNKPIVVDLDLHVRQSNIG